MKSRLTAALAGVALSLSLAACGGHATATPSYFTPETTPTPRHHTSTPAPATPTAAPSPAVPSFQTWLGTNYPGVSWAPLVSNASERFGVLWIETSIYPDADAVLTAPKICSAGRAYALEAGAPYNGSVSVRASTGLRLDEC